MGVVVRDPAQILEPEIALVDSHHSLGRTPVKGDQRISDEQPGRILVGRRHGILEIEDEPVGAIEPGREHELGSIAGKIETTATQTIP